MYWRKYGIESKKRNEKGLGKDEGLEDSRGREGLGEGRRKEWSKGRK
jgi:hypothetical protein